MTETIQRYIAELNDPDLDVRLNAVKSLRKSIDTGLLPAPVKNGSVNSHIHTTFSFSPYSPSKAVWMACNAGLDTAGIADHDTVSGAREFIEAGKILGIATTTGIELRTDYSRTPLNGRIFNNADQKTNVYTLLHGIPHTAIDEVTAFMAPYMKERGVRNIRMVGNINDIMKPYDISLDYTGDVLPLSMWYCGGSVTERHLLFALSHKIMSKFGEGAAVVTFLKDELGLSFSRKVEAYLLDETNIHYDYDLLGALKSSFVEQFYVDATAESPDISDVLAFSNKIGAISAYPYLGDVAAESVTGDKKTQKFEDEFLEQLFEVITQLGFKAVTYAPSRNTPEQLGKLRGLCESYGFLQASGEDINTPRQSFVCETMKNPEFNNLIESAWALIGHERSAAVDLKLGMFSKETLAMSPGLSQRIKLFESIGKMQTE